MAAQESTDQTLEFAISARPLLLIGIDTNDNGNESSSDGAIRRAVEPRPVGVEQERSTVTAFLNTWPGNSPTPTRSPA
jgi:hypothetical protein